MIVAWQNDPIRAVLFSQGMTMMASQLTPCPDCGNLVSTRAASCPKCGSRLQTRPIDVSEKEQIADERFMPEKRLSYRIAALLRKKPLVWAVITVVIVGIVVIVSVGVRGPGKSTQNDQAKTKNKESAEEKAKHEMATLITTVNNLDSPLDSRMAAIRSIGAKGSAGKKAVPALIQVLNNSQQQDLRLAATEALGQIGPEAKESVQSLIEVMKRSDAYSHSQNMAADALLRIASGAEQSAPIVTEVLKWTHDLGRRTAAATALGHCRAVSEESVQLLLVVIDLNKYNPLGRAAVRALGNIGPEAKTALPKLILLPFTSRLETVPDFYFQFDTLEALCKISSDASVKQDAVKRLTDIIEICRKRGLNDPQYYHGKSYSDDLKDLYKVDFLDVSTPYNAIRALGNCGPTARTAIPVLRSILNTDDSDCRKAARDALKKIEQ
jgi:HEAT repeat protein/uncharacterized OB-fold protein